MFFYLWSLRHQFIKYFLVGTSGVFLDIGTLMIFKEWFGLSATLAVVVNQIMVLSYNFSLNKYWSFREYSMPWPQLIRYLLLAGFNYSFSVSSMYAFTNWFDFDYRLVRIATIMVMACWNFLLYKHWVYQSVGAKVANIGEKDINKEITI